MPLNGFLHEQAQLFSLGGGGGAAGVVVGGVWMNELTYADLLI